MDQFSHDLTIALEETSLLDRARVSRWGQQRRRTRSTGNLPCAPQPTEDSSSPTELMFGHATGLQSHATNSNDGLDTHNICLPSDSDNDDKDDDVSMQRLSCNKSTLSVAAIRLGTLESDSLNENFSPSRFFKQTARRKRRLKRISIYYDIMSNLTSTGTLNNQSNKEEVNNAQDLINTLATTTATTTVNQSETQITTLLPNLTTTTITSTTAGLPLTSLPSPSTTSGTNITATSLQPNNVNVNIGAIKSYSTLAATNKDSVPSTCSLSSTNFSGTLRKRGIKPEPIKMPGSGSNCNRTQLFFCGKRKRSNRDRCIYEHYQDHSFSMPRYYTYLEDSKMRPRSFSSTSKPHSDRLLPLNKGLLSKIERIAQQQQQQHEQNNLLMNEEVQKVCYLETDSSDDNDDIEKATQERVNKNVDELVEGDIDLETGVNLKNINRFTTENKDRRRRQKHTPLEQIDKTEVNEMMETSRGKEPQSSTSISLTEKMNIVTKPDLEVLASDKKNSLVEVCGIKGNKGPQLDQKESVSITEERSSLERLELTNNSWLMSFQQKNRNSENQTENQHGTYRIYRKKRCNDSNSNFYYPTTDNANRHLLLQQQQQQQHLNNSRSRQQREHYKNCQQQFYRGAAGILQFSTDCQHQHFQQQKQSFDVMDCEDLDDFSSSSSLSSSESECGRPSVNDTDREGDDELTDCPGSDLFGLEGLNKYEIKRKLLKRSTLPLIKSDPESLSAILTGEDDTIMSGSSTMGSGGGSATATTSATTSNTNTLITAGLDWNSSHFVHSNHSAHSGYSTHLLNEQRLPFPCSEPITITPRSGTITTDSGISLETRNHLEEIQQFSHNLQIENKRMRGETSSTTAGSFMITPQPPPLITPSKLSSTASSNASSCTATSPIEVREIRAGCRRVKDERPGFSIKTSINERLARFLQNSQQSQLRLPDTETYEQDSLNNLANLYSLKMSLDNGCVLFNKTSNTTQSINVEQQNLDGNLLLNDYKRRCYENKDNELFHK